MTSRVFRLRSSDAITVALGLVLLLIATFAVASALIGRFESLEVIAAYRSAGAFDDVRTLVGDESVLVDRYRHTPSAETLARYRATSTGVLAALHAAAINETRDAVTDLADLDQAIALNERYSVAVAELFAAVDTGDRDRADAIDADSVGPAFDRLRAVAIRMERRGHDEALPLLANLATISTFFAVVTPIGFVGFLALVWIFWREQRRVETLARGRAADDAANRTRSALLAGMSHELRTPLNAILGFSELVLEGKDLSERHRIYLQNVRSAGHRLLRIVNEVLAITNVESHGLELRPEVITLSSLLEPVVVFGREHAVRADLTFAVTVPPDLQLIVDVASVRQILTTLLSNAVKYTPARGQVTLSVTVDEAALVVEVADTGVGMPPETLAQTFEPFGRPATEPSIGLGLALVKRLVEAQGGKIAVESTFGGGTVFRIRLPSVITVAKAGARLLVVDDDQIDAGLISALAWEQGLFVEVAGTVAHALAAIGRELPLGVVLDLRLPDGRGEQVLAALRAQPRRMPVVVVTVEDPGMERLDVDEFITKPIDPDRLRAWLARTAGTPREVLANTAG